MTDNDEFLDLVESRFDPRDEFMVTIMVERGASHQAKEAASALASVLDLGGYRVVTADRPTLTPKEDAA